MDYSRAEKEQEQTQPMSGKGRSRRGRWRKEEVAARGTSETGDRYAGQQQWWEQHGKGGGLGSRAPQIGEEEHHPNEPQVRQAVKLLLLRGKAGAPQSRKALIRVVT